MIARFRLVAASTLAATVSLLGACASGLPAGYAELDGHRYRLSPIDTYPVSVARVDDQDYLGRTPVFIDPGPHKITVQGPPDGVSRIGAQRSIDLNVSPCTRYYLVAQKPTAIAVDFKVQVDYQETIPGCTAAAK